MFEDRTKLKIPSETNLLVKDFPLLPYYCDLCWEKYQEASDLYPNKRLLRCKSCKNSYYCNKDCQKEAWNSFHKKECKYLGKSTDYWSKSIENRFVLRVLSRVNQSFTKPFKIQGFSAAICFFLTGILEELWSHFVWQK